MRVITKDVLVQKLNECPKDYISKLKFLYWLSMYGQNMEVENNEPNESSGEIAGSEN